MPKVRPKTSVMLKPSAHACEKGEASGHQTLPRLNPTCRDEQGRHQCPLCVQRRA